MNIKRIIILFMALFILAIFLRVSYHIIIYTSLDEKYHYLKEPRIYEREPQNMVTIYLKGNTIEKHPGLDKKLQKIQKFLRKFHNRAKNNNIRLRYFIKNDEQWMDAGIALSQNLIQLPEVLKKKGYRIETWQYNKTAYLLHRGSIQKRHETRDKLIKYLKKSNYKLSGFTEEEYIKLPMLNKLLEPKTVYIIMKVAIKR